MFTIYRVITQEVCTLKFVHPTNRKLTDTLERLQYTDADYKSIIDLTSQGPMLNGDRKAQVVKSQLNAQQIGKLGKLLPQRCPEEVSECDGRDGAPLWVSIGTDVYDITGTYSPYSYVTCEVLIKTVAFPFSSDEERSELTSNPGGSIPLLGNPKLRDTKELINRLDPYRCAVIRSRKTPKSIPSPRNYTPTMLGWYDNPRMGFYTAINGIVYDFTGKQ